MKKKYNIKGMTCASCQAHVNKAISKIEGVNKCEVNLLNNFAEVEFDDHLVDDFVISKAVNDAGYEVILEQTNKENISDTKKDTMLITLICGIIILLIGMYFSMGHMMWDFKVPKVFDKNINPVGFSLIQFILVLPIIYIYRNYFINGFKRLWKRTPNMDTLIAVGSLFSLLYGIFAMFMISYGVSTNDLLKVHQYAHVLSFESAGMILIFVSIGKYLEHISKKKTTKAIESLMDLAPKYANIKVGDEIKTIKASDVKIGDLVVVKLGEACAVDGEVVEGVASFDQANITGESVPVVKKVGDSVFSSTINKAGYCEIKATKVGEDTSINTIIKLVEAAANSKAPVSKLADKISGIFVPVILGLAILTFIFNIIYIKIANPSYVLNTFETALNFAITVIVIACPCALGLATPVAIMVGTGVGAKCGLLIKNAEILEKAEKIKYVILDKTGTITEGLPSVVNHHTFIKDDLLINVIYAMEAKSEHPLASSVTTYFEDLVTRKVNLADFKQVEGKGLSASFIGDTYKIGNKNFFDNLCSEVIEFVNDFESCGQTVLLCSKNEKIYCILGIKDEIKKTSKEGIKLLQKQGIKVIMLTGDNDFSANIVANEVGVDEVYANVLPEQKEIVIKKYLNHKDGLVAMCGDGVNDALALTKADLGIAIGNGTDVAIDSSDIVLLHDDLCDISNVIRLSKFVLRKIKFGLFWAFFYNFICVLLATGIFYYISNGAFKIQPMHGSIAMSLSSVSVVINALTINMFKKNKNNSVINKEIKEDENSIIIDVEGMMCEHCVKRVKEACMACINVKDVDVSLKENNATIYYVGNLDKTQIVKNIESSGYKARFRE